jgi:integrase
MAWSELSGANWTLPATRNKTGVDLLRPLSPQALGALPAKGGGRFVFSSDGGETPLGGFSKFKAAFDNACGVVGWTVHDLRRTARTLMSRAKVPADHAERCLGHVIGGVRGVYDVYEYRDEKAAAYEALAALVGRILNPAGNLVALIAVRT